jgi:hypothetical protein
MEVPMLGRYEESVIVPLDLIERLGFEKNNMLISM